MHFVYSTSIYRMEDNRCQERGASVAHALHALHVGSLRSRPVTIPKIPDTEHSVRRPANRY
jgi:hypothetical protein